MLPSSRLFDSECIQIWEETRLLIEFTHALTGLHVREKAGSGMAWHAHHGVCCAWELGPAALGDYGVSDSTHLFRMASLLNCLNDTQDSHTR